MINNRRLAPVAAIGSIAIAIALVGPLAAPVAAQEMTTVEVVRAEVIRVFGNSVFLRGEDGEIKRYNEIPEGVRITVEGEEVELSDLREGMILTATLENIPPPVIVTMADVEAASEEPAAEPVEEPAPAREEPAPAQAAPAEEASESWSNLMMWGGLVLLVLVVAVFIFMRKSGGQEAR